MKQFNVIWYPCIGILFLITWILKNNQIPMYIDKFILWVIYQSILVYIIIRILC